MGGVVIEVDFERTFAAWARVSAVSVAHIRERFRFDESYERHERGEISAPQYYEALRASVGFELKDADVEAGWNALFVGVIDDIESALAQFASVLPIYAFSNSNHVHERVWRQQYAKTLASFRQIYVSSTIGLRKPEHAAFTWVANDIGVPLQRILFFDDTLANVDGARRAGMHAVHVRSHQDVLAALSDLQSA